MRRSRIWKLNLVIDVKTWNPLWHFMESSVWALGILWPLSNMQLSYLWNNLLLVVIRYIPLLLIFLFVFYFVWCSPIAQCCNHLSKPFWGCFNLFCHVVKMMNMYICLSSITACAAAKKAGLEKGTITDKALSASSSYSRYQSHARFSYHEFLRVFRLKIEKSWLWKVMIVP